MNRELLESTVDDTAQVVNLRPTRLVYISVLVLYF